MPFDVIKDTSTIQVFKSALKSAEDLQTDYFDMYLMHYPIKNVSDTLEVWRAMETMHDRHSTRFLGICHTNAQFLEWIWVYSRIKPAATQNNFSKATRYDDEVMQFCKTHGIMYQAFRVFAPENQDLLLCSVVSSFAEKYSLSSRQALSNLLIAMYASDGIMFRILDGTLDPKHMKENLTGIEYQINVTDEEITAMRAEMKLSYKININ